MYAKLSDSYQWNKLNSDGALSQKIQELIQKGTIITPDKMPTAMLRLKNKIKSPIMTQMLDAIDSGELVLIYHPEIKVPTYLPFVLVQTAPNSCRGYVFLNNLDSSDNFGDDVNPGVVTTKEVFVNERKLKVSMESCYIAMMIQSLGNSPKLRSTNLIRNGSKVYTTFFTECINRKHSIKLDVNVYNALLYLGSRYFVGTILGCRGKMEPDVLENYCLYNCKQADILAIRKIVSEFTEADFDNVANLINKIKDVPEFQRRLGKLTVSNFLESFINMYDASMLLALENFNYFLYNVLAVNESTYTNNYQILKNMVGGEGRKIYSELIVTVCNRQEEYTYDDN